MSRSHPFLTLPTIPTVRDEVRRLHLDHWNIRDVLIMRMDISHLPATLRTPVQFGSFRLSDLLDRWLGSMAKLPLSWLAPRPLRSLHQLPTSKWRSLSFPSTLQFLHFLLKLFHQCQSSSQLLLQLCDPLILHFQKFGGGRLVALPFSAHRHQFTFSHSSFTRVF